MIVSPAITDPGFREYVEHQVPRLVDVHRIVRAMETHGFVPPGRFRALVHPGTVPCLLTATGPNLTFQNPVRPKQWLGFPTGLGIGTAAATALNLDPGAIAHFDDPARLSPHPSRVGSKRQVYLAGLAILQGMLVDGHRLAGSFDHEFIAAHWQQFELEAYGAVLGDFEVESL